MLPWLSPVYLSNVPCYRLSVCAKIERKGISKQSVKQSDPGILVKMVGLWGSMQGHGHYNILYYSLVRTLPVLLPLVMGQLVISC